MRSSRLLLTPLLLGILQACGGDTDATSPPPPEAVYISPHFVEAFQEDYCCPQIGDNGGGPADWTLEGTTSDRNGMWAPVGRTVILHVRSPRYESLDLSFIVPDTVTIAPGNSLRYFYPLVRLHRLAPAVVRARWSADFSGPTVQLDIYAPHGIGGVRLTAVGVYRQACLNTDLYCETRITGSASGPDWQADSPMPEVRGWVDLTGPWWGWPDGLPPNGYGGTGSSQAWQATLNFQIEDDQGHRGHGGCADGFIPSAELELLCSVLF